jgi:hypothetical protein
MVHAAVIAAVVAVILNTLSLPHVGTMADLMPMNS